MSPNSKVNTALAAELKIFKQMTVRMAQKLRSAYRLPRQIIRNSRNLIRQYHQTIVEKNKCLDDAQKQLFFSKLETTNSHSLLKQERARNNELHKRLEQSQKHIRLVKELLDEPANENLAQNIHNALIHNRSDHSVSSIINPLDVTYDTSSDEDDTNNRTNVTQSANLLTTVQVNTELNATRSNNNSTANVHDISRIATAPSPHRIPLSSLLNSANHSAPPSQKQITFAKTFTPITVNALNNDNDNNNNCELNDDVNQSIKAPPPQHSSPIPVVSTAMTSSTTMEATTTSRKRRSDVIDEPFKAVGGGSNNSNKNNSKGKLGILPLFEQDGEDDDSNSSDQSGEMRRPLSIINVEEETCRLMGRRISRKQLLLQQQQHQQHLLNDDATATTAASQTNAEPLVVATASNVANQNRLERKHHFVAKSNPLKRESCYFCGKLIQFGWKSVKCEACKIHAHAKCGKLLTRVIPCTPILPPEIAAADAIANATATSTTTTPTRRLFGGTPKSTRKLANSGCATPKSTLHMTPTSCTPTTPAGTSGNARVVASATRRMRGGAAALQAEVDRHTDICLEKYCPVNEFPKVPALIIHCVNRLELSGMQQEGLYRMSGSLVETNSLFLQFMEAKALPNLSQTCVNSIANCISKFLSKLEQPLITRARWRFFYQLAVIWERLRIHTEYANDNDTNNNNNSTTDDDDNAVNIINTDNNDDDIGGEEGTAAPRNELELYDHVFAGIQSLPIAYGDTLCFVLLHLQKVAEKKPIKMDLSQLAVVLGPTIVREQPPTCSINDTLAGGAGNEVEMRNQLQDMKRAILVLNMLLHTPGNMLRSILENSRIECENLDYVPLVAAQKQQQKQQQKKQ